MSAASLRDHGEVSFGDSALSPSQAAIDLKLAQAEWDDALSRWSEYTPRELGERAETLWHALSVLRESVAGES